MRRVNWLTLFLCEWITGEDYVVGFRRGKYVVCWKKNRADIVSIKRRRFTEFYNSDTSFQLEVDYDGDPFVRKAHISDYSGWRLGGNEADLSGVSAVNVDQELRKHAANNQQWLHQQSWPGHLVYDASHIAMMRLVTSDSSQSSMLNIYNGPRYSAQRAMDLQNRAAGYRQINTQASMMMDSGLLNGLLGGLGNMGAANEPNRCTDTDNQQDLL